MGIKVGLIEAGDGEALPEGGRGRSSPRWMQLVVIQTEWAQGMGRSGRYLTVVTHALRCWWSAQLIFSLHFSHQKDRRCCS
jgi:hypothetical protein